MRPIHRSSGPASRVAGAVAAALVAAVAPTVALAGPAVLLMPGESATYLPDAEPAFSFPPAGTLVGDVSIPFSTTVEALVPFGGDDPDQPSYGTPHFFTPGGPTSFVQAGVFTSRAYVAGDGTLTFTYDVSLAPVEGVTGGGPALRLDQIDAPRFLAFTTVVSGDVGPVTSLERPESSIQTGHDDGIYAAGPDEAGRPFARLVVDTDARAFIAGGSGSFEYTLMPTVGVFYDGPDGPVDGLPAIDTRFPETITFDGLLYPVAGEANYPAVVPLPAGGWAGLATIGGVGLSVAARRRRESVA